MKNLNDILSGINLLGTRNEGLVSSINELHFDSRKVKDTDAFFALKGVSVNGHDFISSAIENGAKVVFYEEEGAYLDNNEVIFFKVKNASIALAKAAANFYDHPSEKLNLIGITGTNGKTTTVTLLYNLFTEMGETCGLISTVNYLIGEKVYPSTHTTPNVLKLNQLLAEMYEAGCTSVFMEVSSHAIHQNRIQGLKFKGGIFTNITHDHLDYHKTFHAYIHTKKAFFDSLPKSAFALTNIDDRNGEIMLQSCNASKYTYALKSLADYKAKILSHSMEGLELDFNGKSFFTNIVGVYNCYNLLVTYAVAMLLNKNKEITLNLLSKIVGAKGRFETVKDSFSNKIAIVDYAHTSDALEKLLNAVNEVKNRNQNIITVIGCGGDRDKKKRPLMAKVAVQLSDYVVFTSDNPRTEDPEAILDDMYEGVPAGVDDVVFREADRRLAITKAIAIAKSDDLVVVAGKGHEDYQEINGVKYPFDDVQILKQIFKNN